MLQGQLQYRRTESEALNVFPGLGSTTTNTTLTVPVSLNVVHNRTVNNFSVNITHAELESTNAFANVQDVGGLAGINYPTAASTDPQNWGVPRLSFTGLTGVSGAPATSRTDTRLTTSYFWSHAYTKNQLRIGADYRLDRTTSQLNANAPGAFTFTGLYSAGRHPGAGHGWQASAAFADFLLGLPQQAATAGRRTDRASRPLVRRLPRRQLAEEPEAHAQSRPALRVGRCRTPSQRTAGQPGRRAGLHCRRRRCWPAETGPFTGAFPAGLINTDTNNIGPRLGFAYRPVRGTVLRGGYSITYNTGSYATIARRLAAQPPFGRHRNNRRLDRRRR